MIGLFDTYNVVEKPLEYHRQYIPMVLAFLKKHVPGQTVQVYEIYKDQWPGDVNECDSWLIPGSSKSAYDSDPWILQLTKFIQTAYEEQAKLLGVCFGHQLIAHALGGKVEKSKKGWGVGVHEFNVLGRARWMDGDSKSYKLLFSHQDQVTDLPPGAELLGTSPFCPIQLYSIGKRVFCLQGHPEFTAPYLQSILDTRIKMIGKSTYEKAIHSLELHTDENEIARWMQQFILIK